MVAASSATVLRQAALNQKLPLIPEELKLVAVASAPPSTTRFQATGRLWQSKMLNRTALGHGTDDIRTHLATTNLSLPFCAPKREW